LLATFRGIIWPSLKVVDVSVKRIGGSGAAGEDGDVNDLQDGQMMPRKVANKNPQNPNCVGDNVSPQLPWTGRAEGTKSFALLMEDPEGRGGAACTTGWPTGFRRRDQLRRRRGRQGDGQVRGRQEARRAWALLGPCTPPGTPHHYTFVIIATDLDPKELAPGMTREEFLAKLVPPAPAMSHAKGSAGLVGLFVKPN